MKIGDIIRRKISNGAQIGPYMRIKRIHKDKVDAVVDTNTIEGILKSNVYVCNHCSLHIGYETFKNLVKQKTICVQHKATKKWIEAYCKNPEIITFYSESMAHSATFVVEYVKLIKAAMLREDIVRVIISRRI